MAQAQVTLTAVDRTQAAINSALRGMKTLERTAKVTSKAINLAFGFLTGTALVSAFGKITEAAKKTEEGRVALDNLAKALKDPALVSAANNIVNILVNGFTAAVVQITRFIKSARSGLVSLGAVSPNGTAVDATSIIEGQIRNKSILAGQMGMAGQISNVQILTKEIEALKQQLAIAKGLATQEEKIQQAIIAQEVATSKIVKSKATAKSSGLDDKALRDAAEWRKAKEGLESPDMFESSFDAMDVSMAKSVQNMIDEMNAADAIMSEFARSAASSIQSAFADFLFDPFENGIRGMLSGFLNVIRRMIAEVAAQQILQSIFGGFTGGTGFFANFAKAITGKATGGPVSAGTPYIVGERGPELFVPGTSGGIVPNNRMQMGGGVTVSPVYNIDARGATADLQQALPGILAENNRRIYDELDRRYGIGR